MYSGSFEKMWQEELRTAKIRLTINKTLRFEAGPFGLHGNKIKGIQYFHYIMRLKNFRLSNLRKENWTDETYMVE